MEFMDEKWIKLRNQRQQENWVEEETTTIDNNYINMEKALVEINGTTLPVYEQSLLEEKVSIRMPRLFQPMAKELAAIKYPFERRPNPIFTDTTTSINLAFQYTDTRVDDTEIEEFQASMMDAIKKAQPSCRWIEDEVEEIHGRKVGLLEFISPAQDGLIYNLMFFVSVSDLALLGTFNCMEEDMDVWQPVAKGMLQTLTVHEEREVI